MTVVVCLQITEGKVAYMSEMEDGRQRHLVADNDITPGTWHNVTVTVSGQKHVLLTLKYQVSITSQPLNRKRPGRLKAFFSHLKIFVHLS